MSLGRGTARARRLSRHNAEMRRCGYAMCLLWKGEPTTMGVVVGDEWLVASKTRKRVSCIWA